MQTTRSVDHLSYLWRPLDLLVVCPTCKDRWIFENLSYLWRPVGHVSYTYQNHCPYLLTISPTCEDHWTFCSSVCSKLVDTQPYIWNYWSWVFFHQLYKSRLVGNNLKMSPDAPFLSFTFSSYRSNKLPHCNLKGLSTEIYKGPKIVPTYMYML